VEHQQELLKQFLECKALALHFFKYVHIFSQTLHTIYDSFQENGYAERRLAWN